MGEDHLKALTISYSKAPCFKKYLPMLKSIYNRRDEFIADFTIETTIALTRELGNNHTRFMRSSELDGIDGQRTDRLIQILKRVGATHYISGPSAAGLHRSREILGGEHHIGIYAIQLS